MNSCSASATVTAAAATVGAAAGAPPLHFNWARARPWPQDGRRNAKSIEIAPPAAFKFRSSAVASSQCPTRPSPLPAASATLGTSSSESGGGCCCGHHSSHLRRLVECQGAPSGYNNCLLSSTGRRRSLSARRRKFISVTATREEREGSVESPPQKWTLEQLDEQLRVLQEAESSASRRASDERTSSQKNEADADKIRTPPQWPEFSFGFVAFAGIGLMILTLVNNTLYRAFFGPPFVQRQQVPGTYELPRPTFGGTSLEQDIVTRRIRDQQRERMALQSREAPSVR